MFYRNKADTQCYSPFIALRLVISLLRGYTCVRVPRLVALKRCSSKKVKFVPAHCIIIHTKRSRFNHKAWEPLLSWCYAWVLSLWLSMNATPSTSVCKIIRWACLSIICSHQIIRAYVKRSFDVNKSKKQHRKGFKFFHRKVFLSFQQFLFM